MLLLLCCSVKEGDIPEKTEDSGPDAYLAFTREPDDLSDSNQGGESLPPAKKARGDPSVKPASRLRSHNRCTLKGKASQRWNEDATVGI
jgi:hypothetical protein